MQETYSELRQNRLDYIGRCWDSGYRAYERERPRSVCPLDGEAREAWQQGWDRAQYDYEDSPVDE